MWDIMVGFVASMPVILDIYTSSGYLRWFSRYMYHYLCAEDNKLSFIQDDDLLIGTLPFSNQSLYLHISPTSDWKGISSGFAEKMGNSGTE